MVELTFYCEILIPSINEKRARWQNWRGQKWVISQYRWNGWAMGRWTDWRTDWRTDRQTKKAGPKLLLEQALSFFPGEKRSLIFDYCHVIQTCIDLMVELTMVELTFYWDVNSKQWMKKRARWQNWRGQNWVISQYRWNGYTGGTTTTTERTDWRTDRRTDKISWSDCIARDKPCPFFRGKKDPWSLITTTLYERDFILSWN